MLSNCLLNITYYLHKILTLSPSAREVSLCSGPRSAVTTETCNRSTYWDSGRAAQTLNVTFISTLSLNPQEASQNRGKKKNEKLKSLRIWRNAVECCLLNTVCPLYQWTHYSFDFLNMIELIRSVSIPTVTGLDELWRKTKERAWRAKGNVRST